MKEWKHFPDLVSQILGVFTQITHFCVVFLSLPPIVVAILISLEDHTEHILQGLITDIRSNTSLLQDFKVHSPTSLHTARSLPTVPLPSNSAPGKPISCLLPNIAPKFYLRVCLQCSLHLLIKSETVIQNEYQSLFHSKIFLNYCFVSKNI